jgi:hypothetical protein
MIDVQKIEALMSVVAHISAVEIPRIRRVHGATLESANGIVRALEAAHQSAFEARALATADPVAYAALDGALRLVEDRLGDAIAESLALADAEIELMAEAAAATKH